MLVGVTLGTRPEDIYRALIEATAFGTRKIIESFESRGVPVREFTVAGGLLKNPLVMQIYSDVLRRPLHVIESDEGPALGAAMHAAVAAGVHPDIKTASAAMGRVRRNAYLPDEERADAYDELYAHYSALHDHFGRGAMMHALRRPRRRKRRAVGDDRRAAASWSARSTPSCRSTGSSSGRAGTSRRACPGEDLMVIKASGVDFDAMTPESIVVCDLFGRLVEGGLSPSSDAATHGYVYRHLPEVGAVAHTHSAYATAFAARGEAIPCVLTAMADEFGGEIPLGPFARIGDEEIGRGIVETLAGHRSPAVLMQSHGVFTLGATPRDAIKAAVMCEDVARTVHLARALGDPLLTRRRRHRRAVRPVPERLRPALGFDRIDLRARSALAKRSLCVKNWPAPSCRRRETTWQHRRRLGHSLARTRSRLRPAARAGRSMYPYYGRFDEERREADEQRFWFWNSMHFPVPMPAFDAICIDTAYQALGSWQNRVFAVPPAMGIDWRCINGYIYISGNPVLDPEKIAERAGYFQQRAGYYYENWDELYAKWRTKMDALIAELGELQRPAARGVRAGRGRVRRPGDELLAVLDAYRTALRLHDVMWQHHFEFLLLGYGAYMTFAELCKANLPDIPDQHIAQMVAGLDVLLFRPDAELRRLARLAIDTGVDSAFVEGRSPEEIDAELARERGRPRAGSRSWRR